MHGSVNLRAPGKVLATAVGWPLVTQPEAAQMEGKEFPAQM